MVTPPRTALVVFLVLAAVHTWPLSGSPATKSLNHNADAEQWAWTLSWIPHALAHQPTRLFDGNIFAPEPRVLALSDPVIVPGVMAIPLRALGASPVLTFNLVMLAGLVLTAWAGWLVAWRWTGSSGAAIVTGALVAFNTHLLTRLAHIPAAHSWGLPLTLYLADRLIGDDRDATQRTYWRDGALLALVIAAVAATSIYTLAFAGLIVAVVMVCALPRWRAIARIALSSAGGLLLALPALSPYVRLARTGITRPLEMVTQFSATPAGYLTSLSHLDAGWTARFFRDDVNVLFAGVVALLLAAAGVVSLVSAPAQTRRRGLTLLVLAVAGVWLSFGPATAAYRVLYDWLTPLRGLRAAARFGYVYLMAVAVAAGIGVAWIERRLPSRRAQRAWCVVALALVTVEAWSAPIVTVPFKRLPPIYDMVATAAPPVMLVEIPFFPPEAVFENGEYMLNAAAHWQPVMNGYSGATPDTYRRRTESFWFFPEDWAIDSIVREGATHVMVHLERLNATERADVERALPGRHDLRLVASDAIGHRLYVVER